MADLEKLVEDLSGLTLIEAAELTKMLEEKWGVSAAAAPVGMPMMGMAMAGAPGGGGEAAAEEEEKTEFDVKLAEIGPKKINVIKEVRALTSLGLKEAKEAVDGLAVIMEGVSKEAAEEAKEKLEAAGAKVEIK
ncbi:MAG: 50S ribosomal protein L7/L12 [Chloroflexota bacterium]